MIVYALANISTFLKGDNFTMAIILDKGIAIRSLDIVVLNN